MAKASPLKYSYNGGEASELMGGRVDQAKYPNLCSVMRNFIPCVQGPAVRRGGTYFTVPVKDNLSRTWLGNFQFNVTQAYILEFGNFYIRFYTSHAQVLSGGVAYEISAPYAIADLTDSDGAFALTLEQSRDVIYMTHSGGLYPFQKLQRFGNTNWTVTAVDFQGGPFKDSNIDTTQTVYSNAETGSVTLTSNTAIFNPGHVGSLFYLEENQAGTITPWEAGKTVAIGDRRRSDGKTYIAQNAGTTGNTKLTHTLGLAYDGAGGVQWLYADPSYGTVKITGYTSGTVVTGTVITRLPIGAVGSGNATFRWAHSRYSGVEGYAERVAFFRERLVLAKGVQLDMSQSADFENFASKDFGQIIATSAIKIAVQGSQLNKIQWMISGNDLLLGTADGEYAAGEITSSDPLGPANIRIKDQTKYGGRGVKPVKVGDSIAFVQRSGRKLRDIIFSFDTNGYKGRDLTVLSEHLTKGGIIDMAYQQEPYSVIWCVTGLGKLIGFTYNSEQEVLAWHPHPIGGNGFVESVKCIPAPDNKRDELWLIVRRTINGVTKRYVEWMAPELDTTTQRQQDSFYVDCGLSLYNTMNATLTPGANATTKQAMGVMFTAGSAIFSAADVGRLIHYDYTITNVVDGEYISTPAKAIALITGYIDTTHVTATINKPWPSLLAIAALGWRKTVTGVGGFAHLEGMLVDILIDGATHPQRTVTGGAVTLQSPASVVHVGLPAPCKVKGMRVEAGSQIGTAQGKIKRSNSVMMRFKDTLGGRYGARDELLNDLQFRTAANPMDEPPPLFSGDKIVTMPEGYDTDGYIIYKNAQPLPATLICWTPNLETQDKI